MVFESLKKIVLEKKHLDKTRPEIVARELEENKVLQILNKLNKNNCIVIGKKGVGKTSLLKSLAFKINPNIVIVDDVHLLDDDKALELKQKIVNKEIRCLLSTSISVFKGYKDVDGFFADNFTPVLITEPDRHSLLEIVKMKAKELEDFHNLKINPAIFLTLFSLAKRYIFDVSLPMSAVDSLDAICAQKKINYIKTPDDLEALSAHIAELKSNPLGLAQKIELKALESKYKKIYEEWQNDVNKKHLLTSSDVYDYFVDKTGIELEKITESFEEKINRLERVLNKKLVGQKKAIKELLLALREKFVEGRYPHRPLVLFLTGPNGVGKYKMLKIMASVLFDDEANLVFKPSSYYQVVLTDDVSLIQEKSLRNCVLVFKKNNDFVDNVVEFEKLEKKYAREVAKNQILEIEELLKEKNIRLEVEEQAYMFLVSKGYSLENGVENMRAVIKKEIITKIYNLFCANDVRDCKIFVYFQSGALEIKVKN